MHPMPPVSFFLFFLTKWLTQHNQRPHPFTPHRFREWEVDWVTLGRGRQGQKRDQEGLKVCTSAASYLHLEVAHQLSFHLPCATVGDGAVAALEYIRPSPPHLHISPRLLMSKSTWVKYRQAWCLQALSWTWLSTAPAPMTDHVDKVKKILAGGSMCTKEVSPL